MPRRARWGSHETLELAPNPRPGALWGDMGGYRAVAVLGVLMKRFTLLDWLLLALLALFVASFAGCATIQRHKAITSAVVIAVVAGSIAASQHHASSVPDTHPRPTCGTPGFCQ